MKKILVATLVSSMWVSGNATTFQALSDSELAAVDGQALHNFSKDNYTYTNANSE